jgi:hypothetical protein
VRCDSMRCVLCCYELVVGRKLVEVAIYMFTFPIYPIHLCMEPICDSQRLFKLDLGVQLSDDISDSDFLLTAHLQLISAERNVLDSRVALSIRF